MKQRASLLIVLALLLLLVAVAHATELAQEVYVWQRDWTGQVREAVTNHADAFAKVVVLQTEITWKKGAPQIVHVPIDYASLLKAKCAVGVALRIGYVPGLLQTNEMQRRVISHEIAAMLHQAEEKHLTLAELQIDYDCAESKLVDYAALTRGIRREFPTAPVVITALPAWLERREFAELAHAANSFVLQVHSFERPKTFEALFTLCDPPRAIRAVEQANLLGLPFRVALPTYGYMVAYNSAGQVIGLAAEGATKAWPKETRLKKVDSSPSAMALLVNFWTTNRPSHLQAIIWYRMPVAHDALNWSWPTLRSVMHGVTPQAKVEIPIVRPEANLVELHLTNSGEADFELKRAIRVRWSKNSLLASDGLRGFDLIDSGAHTVQFRRRQFLPPLILRPGERCVVGWLRFTENTGVQCEFTE